MTEIGPITPPPQAEIERVNAQLRGDMPAMARDIYIVLWILRELPLDDTVKKMALVNWCGRAGLRMRSEWVTYVTGRGHIE